MLATKNEIRRKPNRSQPAYVGGFVSPEQKAKANIGIILLLLIDSWQ
jgi:hypothetical protein